MSMARSVMWLPSSVVTLVFCILITCEPVTVSANFNELVNITWGDGRGKISESGDELSLTIDKASGSGFKSKSDYHFARFDIEIKLIPNNSSGLVTTFFVSAPGEVRDEIDLEFLGNVTGEPVTLHTNVFAEGQGRRERGFHLWFDASADYHKYSIVWNPQRIIFMVDDKAIRVHENLMNIGVPYPTRQRMWLYASLWNADQWATQGGRLKTDWSKGPFTVHYRNLKVTAYDGNNQTLTEDDKANIIRIDKEFKIYDHCNFNIHPLECNKPA
ncbi:Xyloglucan endotransglucosylase/hydrolase [Melia azedarach]|uniref:Xyloglucan endotransglucosylase/hydrolase n=1 Tax=Melia azedarach TaxID=155640 RepID=A0ACC1Z094_MELAZ|nr:Xyloglucan endotransglucosylase/hydrolase [Melia azedarach]